MYELFGFELADFKELFYVFCLAVLVYRYITVGRKYPLFGTRNKTSHKRDKCGIEETSQSSSNPCEYSEFDVTDPRSLEHWYSQRSKF